jgi:hypothetical protein
MTLSTKAATAKDSRNAGSEMQHRHFATIAAIIKDMTVFDNLGDGDEWRKEIAYHFADELAKTNPRFDRDRFLKACGAKE